VDVNGGWFNSRNLIAGDPRDVGEALIYTILELKLELGLTHPYKTGL
jgi:hypothetical protein